MTDEVKIGDVQMKIGDQFTLPDVGYSARGHKVHDGRSVKTGRKMKCVRLEVFKVIDWNSQEAKK